MLAVPPGTERITLLVYTLKRYGEKYKSIPGRDTASFDDNNSASFLARELNRIYNK